MNALRVGLRKLYGLFVDDLGFALAIAGWIAVAAVASAFVDPVTRGPLLFAGLAVVLAAGVARAAGDSSDRP